MLAIPEMWCHPLPCFSGSGDGPARLWQGVCGDGRLRGVDGRQAEDAALGGGALHHQGGAERGSLRTGARTEGGVGTEAKHRGARCRAMGTAGQRVFLSGAQGHAQVPNWAFVVRWRVAGLGPNSMHTILSDSWLAGQGRYRSQTNPLSDFITVGAVAEAGAPGFTGAHVLFKTQRCGALLGCPCTCCRIQPSNATFQV